MNISSSTKSSNINNVLFSLSLGEWFNIQNYFAAYILPIFMILSIAANVIIITIFCSTRTFIYIAPTARFYYIAIAIVDLGSLLLYHIPENFLSIGAKVLFNFWSFNLSVQSDTTCQFYTAITLFFPHCIGWIYMLFDIERLLIISHPFRRFNERKIMMCVWIGIATVVLVGVLCCIGTEGFL